MKSSSVTMPIRRSSLSTGRQPTRSRRIVRSASIVAVSGVTVCRSRFMISEIGVFSVEPPASVNRITGVTGLAEFMRSYGQHVVEQKLLPVGSQRRNWKNTLVSDGYILLRHPDWAAACELANIVATEVNLYAE